MGKNKDKFDFDGSNILSFAIRRYKLLLVITIVAAVISALASLTIPNMFKSEVVMFPSTSASISRSITDINYSPSKGDFMSIGIEEQVDQLLQMVESNEIAGRIINKYNLLEHYKIDKNSKGAYTRLYKTFESNVKISRTEYGSVVVDIWDEDPKFAAAMANEYISLTDTAFKLMLKDRAVKAYAIARKSYDSIDNEVNILLDSLTVFNKMGILDYANQTQELTKAYYNAIASGNNNATSIFRKKLDILEKYGSRAVVLRDEIVFHQRTLTELRTKLVSAQVLATHNIPYKFVINKAGVSESKDRPKRMIIVLFSALAAFFAALFLLVIIENIKKLV